MDDRDLIIRLAKELYDLKNKLRKIEDIVEDINLGDIENSSVKHALIDISAIYCTRGDYDHAD